MKNEKSIEPIGFTKARVLTDAEITNVGGGLTAPQGTLTGSGGGDPGPIHVSPDGDFSADF